MLLDETGDGCNAPGQQTEGIGEDGRKRRESQAVASTCNRGSEPHGEAPTAPTRSLFETLFDEYIEEEH